jgi:hypothetical protein
MRQTGWLSIVFLLSGCKEDVCGDGDNNPDNLCFVKVGDFASGEQPFSVAIGDLDRDGDADVVTADRIDGTVSVLLQTNGVFARQAPILTQPQPSSVTLADFDGNGSLDIAVACSGLDADVNPDPVSILLNNGSGGFAAPVDNLVGDRPVAIVAADFSGDGRADIAAVNNIGGAAETFSTLINNGNGTFAPQVFSVGSASPVGLAAGDLDDDGDLDVAIANASINQVGISFNTGGSLNLGNSVPVGSLPSAMVIFDTDSDGDNDIVVAQLGDNNMQIITNDGPNVFTAQPPIDTGIKPKSLATGDLNADGFLDLVIVNQDDNRVALFINNKAGSFERKLFVNVGISPVFVATADINGDGVSDFVTANETNGNVTVIFSNP